MDKKNNILIIEDHALTAFALKTSISTLEFAGDIYEAADAKSALDILQEKKIDLILLDLGLPGVNGVDALGEIRKINKNVKVIVLTSHCEKDEVLACLEASISAYCTKDIKPDKLCDVIEDVLSGSMYFDSAVSGYVMEQTKRGHFENSSAEITIKDCYNLTQQEKRVLILLASGHNNSQIAEKLSISINTTKVHVCSILQKMNVEDRTQAAIKAIRENLIN